MNKYLGNFHVIRPDYDLAQEKTVAWIAQAHARAKGNHSADLIKRQLERIAKGVSKIKKRGVHCGDFFHTDWEKMKIYNITDQQRGSGFKERSAWFEEAVMDLFERFYPAEASLPSNLIHVTCTGYVAPSGAQKIVSRRKAATAVIHIYHMGCCASFPALRTGKGLEKEVDVVHTEICSLHLDALSSDLPQFIIQNLFADGFVKYSLSSKKKEFEILALHEEVIPETPECITWRCMDWGFAMTLKREVPEIISKSLEAFLENLAKKAKSSAKLLKKEAFFAIHPGGPKIIEQIGELLELKNWQMAHSFEVMENYGNMSSATLPHIWEKMTDSSVPENAAIVSFSFGPGITLCGSIFKKVRRR
jgi:predicted naringenin-chalcone synthase